MGGGMDMSRHCGREDAAEGARLAILDKICEVIGSYGG